jgi:hypothetical protein
METAIMKNGCLSLGMITQLGYLTGFILPQLDSFGSSRNKQLQDLPEILFSGSSIALRFGMGLLGLVGPHSQIFYIDLVEVCKNRHQGTCSLELSVARYNSRR